MKKKRQSESRRGITVGAVLSKENVEIIDELAEGLGCSRSQFVRMCVEIALDDWSVMKKFGLGPRRIKKLGGVLKKLGFAKQVEALERETSEE